jgi:RNA polymerase sigma factor (sigma-70 family)
MSDTTIDAHSEQREDEAVIRAVLTGNVNEFARLEKKYRRIVAFLVRKMIRNEQDVEDLVQDTFVRAFAALPSFQFEYPFSRWLYRIASNRCIDHIRRKRFAMYSLDEPRRGRDDSDYVVEIRDSGLAPDGVLLAKERAELLRGAFEELPEKYKVVIRMRHEEELDYQEIAERLSLPLGTVKAHIFRARKRMYAALTRTADHAFEEYLGNEDPS